MKSKYLSLILVFLFSTSLLLAQKNNNVKLDISILSGNYFILSYERVTKSHLSYNFTLGFFEGYPDDRISSIDRDTIGIIAQIFAEPFACALIQGSIAIFNGKPNKDICQHGGMTQLQVNQRGQFLSGGLRYYPFPGKKKKVLSHFRGFFLHSDLEFRFYKFQTVTVTETTETLRFGKKVETTETIVSDTQNTHTLALIPQIGYKLLFWNRISLEPGFSGIIVLSPSSSERLQNHNIGWGVTGGEDPATFYLGGSIKIGVVF